MMVVLAAFLRRDWADARAYRAGLALSLVNTVLTLTLYFYFGKLVSVEEVDDPALSRGYLAFATVGIALLEPVYVGLSSFSTRLRIEQTSGSLEALLATPTSPSLVILGSAAYDLLRSSALALATVGIACVVFGVRLALTPASLLATAVAFVACIVLFAAVGIVMAATTLVIKRTGALLNLTGTGLALLAGAYYPTEVLPAPLRWVGQVLPLTWGLEVLRAGLISGDVASGRLVLLVGSAGLALPASLWIFGVGLGHVRKRGTLAHF